MQWKILGLVVAVSTALVTFGGLTPIGAVDVAGQTVERAIVVDGQQRTFLIHVPNDVTAPGGLPVLIVLHGGGGNGKQVERSTGFSGLADEEGFIAVYPDGTGRLPRRLTWNAYNCCAHAHTEAIDDVAFISALIDELSADPRVDASRIYITGHSNGAMMTFRIACELADKIAAAAPYAGALNSDTCAPSRPVPILIMNGEDDENVPIAGGTSEHVGFASEDARVDQPTSFAVDTWTSMNGCHTEPVVTDTPAAFMSVWSDCDALAEVEQILIHDWAHGWPDPDEGAPLDGSRIIWNFVARFSTPRA